VTLGLIHGSGPCARGLPRTRPCAHRQPSVIRFRRGSGASSSTRPQRGSRIPPRVIGIALNTAAVDEETARLVVRPSPGETKAAVHRSAAFGCRASPTPWPRSDARAARLELALAQPFSISRGVSTGASCCT
jgi:hypothetical protein